MFDLGDELIIGSQRIPWLIWIQLLVMLLLIILLYYFTVSALGLDPSPSATVTAAAASTSTVLHDSGSAAAASTSRLHNFKVGEGHSIKDDIGTSTRRRRIRREDTQEREGISYHPCHYFGLAKQAFLKCLGFDPTSKDSSNSRHRKEE
ncbi:hypothetical protein RHGRI_022343 [Rhododendron griersonianum]|uniref:Uncharacterized protein n=1 Tax=Rhododendron griersonianum TaxID=479676 RepID=A0AAV6J181_9ERIC|nr:hypothetical protein RHGRI_022343 [Rhododendron griersonianum]